jgi:DNA (cytosine-5)-methyltransferase 1
MTGPTYYSENDPYAARWLRNLIAAGHIAPGDVDDRSIADVQPDDLRGYCQCHFFAGIGAWSHALRLAGWPDDRPVWTGSCPCQPFSASGKGKGHEDERHLWPAWRRLISKCGPSIVFGEQVASADGLAWLDAVLSDLENDSHAVAAVDFPACGVGAPHIRQRLFWLAHALRLGVPPGEGLALCIGYPGILGGTCADDAREVSARAGALHDPWANVIWIDFAGGKSRPIEPSTCPLAYGLTNRVGRLRAYGNAIVPQVAAEVIRAYMAYAP